MTPEQHESWRQAIHQVLAANAAPGQDFSDQQRRDHGTAESALLALLPEEGRRAFLKSRLLASTERLMVRDIPRWAIELRSECINRGYWPEAATFEFLLRSEIALIGLELSHPTKDAQATAYRRLLLSFFYNALEPFVEWVEQQRETTRREYCDFVDLYDFLDGLDTLPSQEEWDAKERTMNYQKNVEIVSSTSRQHCQRLLEIARLVLFKDPDIWWRTTDTDLALRFLEMHARSGPILPVGISRRPAYRIFFDNDVEIVTTAYLAALEAECPPPDWLSGAVPL
ncbi:MAG: hypothetical protein QM758_05900 [Armatimonas sp.]